MAEDLAGEFVQPPATGRVFALARRPGLGDCAPSGRIRLDALARWLQDVAYLDVLDAGVADSAVWVLRRTRMRIDRFPRFGELCNVTTFCSGMGKMWAERRTSIVSAESGGEALVEAVALWVHLDPATRQPSPFNETELAIYGASTNGRRVRARLRHRPPEALHPNAPWAFRTVDCDVADHVNNAAYWQPLEEELLQGDDPDTLDVEVEFRSPAQPGEKLLVKNGRTRWIVAPDGETHATIVLGG